MPDRSPASPYEVTSSDVLYESRFSRVRIDSVRMPDGQTTEREIIEHLSAVGAVPIDEQDHVILLRQYRHSMGRHFLEIPAGKLDVDGEDVADAMQRELAEEIEMSAARMEHLLTYTNSAGWSTETTHVYLATGLTAAPRPKSFVLQHEEADMEVLRVPFDNAVAMVHDGRIVDSKTVIGLLAIADRRHPRPPMNYVKHIG
ncbi:MAG TPA: NUDIX hydrolase [Euzebya sp.]|nr:NUDIX hydrolase [Euzebya sp.]